MVENCYFRPGHLILGFQFLNGNISATSIKKKEVSEVLNAMTGQVDGNKSYVVALGEVTSIPVAFKASIPFLTTGTLSIPINMNTYNERLALCQFSWISRVIIAKGEARWKLVELKLKLSDIWDLKDWKFISPRKGVLSCLITFSIASLDF